MVEDEVIGNNRPSPPDTNHQEVKDVNLGTLEDSPIRQDPLQPYNVEKQHDWVRTIITCSFVFIFAITVIAAFAIVAWAGPSWANTKELIQLLLPAETALLGSAVGFYFGSQKAN